MTSIDDIFRKPNLPSKRKLEAPSDPTEAYKSAKTSANGHAKRPSAAHVEDDDDGEGPQLPPDGYDGDYGPDDEEGRFFGSGLDDGEKDAIDYLDQQEQETTFVPEKFDLPWLRKMTSNFERRIAKNAELRSKFADEPQKFMESEANLDADIQDLSILSEHSELYGEFATLGGVSQLVSLLSHENTDIAIKAIEIINELTDEEVNAEEEQWDALVDALLEADLLDLLIQNFERLDETDESDRNGVYHSLSVFENIASRPTIADRIGKDTKLLPWLKDRIQVKETPPSQNKQYAAEILSILLQASSSNRHRFVELNGVDVLLTILSAYRKRDPPKDSAEEEYAENLFDSLTCVVDESTGKAKFVEAEGIELCLLMLKEGNMSKPRALTILDHAVAETPSAFLTTTSSTTVNGKPNKAGSIQPMPSAEVCDKIIEAEGLKRLFSLFMKKLDGSMTEHLLSIFASLLRFLPGGSAPRIRLLAKFVEKDYEKLEKILQLRRDYSTRMQAVDAQIKREQANLSKQEKSELEDVYFGRRLDSGLFCLQTLDIILAWLVAEDDGAKRKIVAQLAERDESLEDVRKTLQEQSDGVNEDTGGEEGIKGMLDALIPFLA